MGTTVVAERLSSVYCIAVSDSRVNLQNASRPYCNFRTSVSSMYIWFADLRSQMSLNNTSLRIFKEIAKTISAINSEQWIAGSILMRFQSTNSKIIFTRISPCNHMVRSLTEFGLLYAGHKNQCFLRLQIWNSITHERFEHLSPYNIGTITSTASGFMQSLAFSYLASS